MAETIDELTVEYVEDDITTVKELDKVILTKGAWSTIIYKIQNESIVFPGMSSI